MGKAETLITEHLDIWTSGIKAKSSAGRGGGKKEEFYGIKKLRELILELAIAGGLVHSIPDESPIPYASKKSEYSINNTRPPKNWRTILLSDGVENRSGNSKLIKGKLHSEPAGNRYQGFSASGADVWCDDYEHEGDAIIISAVGARCGKAFKATGKWSAIANTNITRPNPGYFAVDFAYLVFNNEHFWVRGGSAQPFVKFPPSLKRYFSVPPLAEQQRIVAKVDELMVLCDRLEQQQEDSVRTHGALVETLLGALTAASERGAFADAWQRIASHFDTLFTTESSIDQLKQTILQLAVMGKLVEQDPEDESASELLRKVAAIKEKLIKEGRLKKQKSLPGISEDETPFEIPAQWEWCKFGLVAEFINGDRSKSYPNKSEYVRMGMPWINTGHIEPEGTLTVGAMNYITKEKFDSLRGGKVEPGDLVYCLRGATFGKTAFITPYTEGAIASSLMIIRPYLVEFGSYIYRYLISPFGRSQIFRFDNGSAQPNLSANSVKIYAFPCPPLAEQHRIVAKVDELMALCDQLKARLQSARTTQLHLADSLVEAAIH